jgi:Uncharacterized membrane protein (homolog of Drosophila rhomboid)
MKATKQTLGAIVTVFIAQLLSISFLPQVSMNFYTLAYPLISSDPWAIILNVYSHAGFGHLIGNAVALLILGIIVERVTTPARFHLFFIVTGIVAGLSEITFWLLIGSDPTSVLGASGAIFALMGYAVVDNNLADTLIESLDLGKKGTALLFVGLAALVTAMTASEGVAIIAHATGFLMGTVSGHLKILRVEEK